MNPRKNKISQKKEGSHLTILLILFIVAAVILSLILLFGQRNNVTSSATGTNTLIESFINTDRPGGAANSEVQKENLTPSPQLPKTSSPTSSQISENSSNTSTTTSSSGTSQKQVAILCTEESSIFCALKKTNSFTSFLDNNPFITGIIFDGKKVLVEKISHQLVFRTLANNKVTDSAGKALTSSSVAYKEQTKELVVLIGVDRKYYESLGVSEQKTLYISQLVRAIFAVTEEVPSNYPKVAKIVGKLIYWDPNSE